MKHPFDEISDDKKSIDDETLFQRNVYLRGEMFSELLLVISIPSECPHTYDLMPN